MPNQTEQPINNGVTWGLLNQRHDCYDAVRTKKLELLLKGGFDITKKPNAKLFMPRWRAESPNAYADRLTFATYQNNFGEIINDYGSTLFSKPLAVLPATDSDNDDTAGTEPEPDEPYVYWQSHFTLDNRTMADFLKDIEVESDALGCSYFGVDFQDGKPYAYSIDASSVLDYQCDDEGNFVFLVLRDDDCSRTSIRQMRDSITTTFTVWTMVDEKVECKQYRITYPKLQEPPDEKVVSSVKVQNDEPLTFKNIPVIAAHTPDNMCIGQAIGELQAAIFMRYSTFLFCLNRGLNPLLVYKQGAELPANGDLSDINEDGERGENTLSTANVRGAAVIGPTDELSFEGPDGAAYKIAQEQLDKDKNEMYRLVSNLGSMVSTQGTTSSSKTPAMSKLMDNKAKENLLMAKSKLIKSWVIKAFSLAFNGSDDIYDSTLWQTKGMDNYSISDEDTLLAKIKGLPDYRANMPSKTSYEQVLLDIAAAMHPFTNPGTLSIIQDEIKNAIAKMDVGDSHVQNVLDQQNKTKETNANDTN